VFAAAAELFTLQSSRDPYKESNMPDSKAVSLRSKVVTLGTDSGVATLKSAVANLSGAASAKVVLKGDAAQLKSAITQLGERAQLGSAIITLKGKAAK